jgi:hypothetical protein
MQQDIPLLGDPRQGIYLPQTKQFCVGQKLYVFLLQQSRNLRRILLVCPLEMFITVYLIQKKNRK